MIPDPIEVNRAWQEFVTSGQIDCSVVRDEVAQSWRRCRDAGLDPQAAAPPLVKSDNEIREILQSNAAYIEAAMPFLRLLEAFVRGTGSILVLTNDTGTVLELLGDRDVLARAEENHYVPGCCRTEVAVGTNAIALALLERRPIQLSGAEHFNVHFRSWTCASAPILSPDGKLLGCVTLSGGLNSAQAHTLGMVVSTAEAIQTHLRERVMEIAGLRHEQFMTGLLRATNEALIMVNTEGYVVKVNRIAEDLLGQNQELICGNNAAIFFGAPQLARLLQSPSDASIIEMAFESSGRRNHLIARPYLIRDNAANGSSEHILGAVLALSKRRDFVKHVRDLSGLRARFHLSDIVGQDEILRRQIELANIAAKEECRILITGETGTGKELLVQGIHNASRRADGPFVAINCAALPRELLEAELLGYVDGAFTSARRGGQIGKFELADGGTLFLDEIGQLPFDMQAKLLRVLQDGIVTRLGDTKPIPVDVRIIAATNESLFEESQAGTFRSDLYFRLCSVELFLPPLRERGEDICLLTDTILERLRRRLGRPMLKVSPEVLDIFHCYAWPGNIRELENSLEMAAITSRDGILRRENLPPRLRGISAEGPSAKPRLNCNGSGERRPTDESSPIRALEAEALRQALNQHNGQISIVSRELGISRSTIYRRMREIGINRVMQVVEGPVH